MDTDPEAVIAQHYDIVVNGIEIGGGSIRIHQPEMQLKVLRDIMKLSPERLRTFDHLITVRAWRIFRMIISYAYVGVGPRRPPARWHCSWL